MVKAAVFDTATYWFKPSYFFNFPIFRVRVSKKKQINVAEWFKAVDC